MIVCLVRVTCLPQHVRLKRQNKTRQYKTQHRLLCYNKQQCVRHPTDSKAMSVRRKEESKSSKKMFYPAQCKCHHRLTVRVTSDDQPQPMSWLGGSQLESAPFLGFLGGIERSSEEKNVPQRNRTLLRGIERSSEDRTFLGGTERSPEECGGSSLACNPLVTGYTQTNLDFKPTKTTRHYYTSCLPMINQTQKQS